MSYPFFVPDNLVIHPPEAHLERGLVKHLVLRGKEFKSFAYKYVQKNLLLQYLALSAGIRTLDRLMVVCFRPCADGSSDHMIDVLKRGVCLEGACYRFLGHSETQLKDKTCFLINDSELEIYDCLAKFMDFSKLKGVQRRAECVGLLLQSFEKTLYLKEDEFLVIKDANKGKLNFSKGCGFMSLQFAMAIQMIEGLASPPSVAQVIHQGFAGVLLLRNDMNAVQVEFRESMKKFSIPAGELRDMFTSVGLMDYSRPYSNGYLNAQIVMLLADRGVSRDYLRHLQDEYYELLNNLSSNKSRAAYYLRATGEMTLLNHLVEMGIDYTRTDLEKLKVNELEKMKRCDQLEGGRGLPKSHHGWKTRLRVLVPKSRVVFGVCDPYEVLNYGECYFRPSISDEEEGEFMAADRVVVIRNPCYHPGDVRVLKIVRKRAQLSHLRDCIVFPTKGPRPHALECSGGDLDGDKFFVTWDKSLIPRWKTAPHEYGPSAIEHLGGRLQTHSRKSIKQVSMRVRQRAQVRLPSLFGDPDDYERQLKLKSRQGLTEYFANYHTDTLGKLDAVFMKYASARGPSSQECRQLHKCYADLVSGAARTKEIERTLGQYERDFETLPPLEARPRPSCYRRLAIRLGWAKPDFQEGDDVWETMERRAREFLEQAPDLQDASAAVGAGDVSLEE